jgi:phosphoglycolate/pyridoxal phosphate phosphatase family enzyme
MICLDKNGNSKDLIQHIQTFIFDCDGVLWSGKTKINGADKVIKMLNKKNKQILFVTNASTKTTDILIDKFDRLDIPIQPKKLVHAGLATAFYLNNLNLKSKSNIYIVGSKNLQQTLIKNTKNLIFSGLNDNNKTLRTFSENNKELDLLLSDIKSNTYSAVVVGWDNEFNTYKLAKVCSILKYQKKCHFISSNNDFTAPFSPELVMPASGSIISAIETASGRKSICVGKPSKELGINIISKFNLNPSKTCMIGDRIDSDLYFGKNSGFKTCIVLSGVTDLEMLQELDPEKKPDFYANSIASLLDIKE